jgi:hypothetical protein
MINTLNILLVILILLNIVFFILGYVFAKINNSQQIYGSQPNSFFSKNKITEEKNNKITIDERKFVTDIKTSDMEKKYDNLGETKVSDENIQTSIDKLKNIKR